MLRNRQAAASWFIGIIPFKRAWRRRGSNCRISCGGLSDFLWRVVLPRAVRHWVLTTLRERLMKTGAMVVRHAHQITFYKPDTAVPLELSRVILEVIGRLRLPVMHRLAGAFNLCPAI